MHESVFELAYCTNDNHCQKGLCDCLAEQITFDWLTAQITTTTRSFMHESFLDWLTVQR